MRLHVDQTMRTRNFRAWNETVERGAITKGRKGKKVYVEEKVGECFHWKAHGQRSKGDLCSFSHESVSGIGYEAQSGKGQSSSPAPDTKAETDGQEPCKDQAAEDRDLGGEGADSLAKAKVVKPRQVIIGILLCVRSACLKRGRIYGKKCRFRHVEAEEEPS